MLSGRPVGENWIISSSSDREASGASATLWLGMRVMALLSRRAAARGQGTVTGKDAAAAGTVTGGPGLAALSPRPSTILLARDHDLRGAAGPVSHDHEPGTGSGRRVWG